MTYRIRPIRPDKYVVEKKRWYGIYTCHFYIDDNWSTYPKTFKTDEEAKLALWNYLQTQKAIAKHLAQPSLYLKE